MAYPSNRGQHSSRDPRRVDGGKVRHGATLAAADAFRSSPPHIRVLGELEQSQSSQTRKDRQNSLEHGQESFLPREVSILMKKVVVVARCKLNCADGLLASNAGVVPQHGKSSGWLYVRRLTLPRCEYQNRQNAKTLKNEQPLSCAIFGRFNSLHSIFRISSRIRLNRGGCR